MYEAPLSVQPSQMTMPWPPTSGRQSWRPTGSMHSAHAGIDGVAHSSTHSMTLPPMPRTPIADTSPGNVSTDAAPLSQ